MGGAAWRFRANASPPDATRCCAVLRQARNRPPARLLLDPARVAATKAAIARHDPAVAAAWDALRAEAGASFFPVLRRAAAHYDDADVRAGVQRLPAVASSERRTLTGG